MHFDVVVVGGGVIGLSVALRSAQRGARVCVVDRGELGAGASRAAAGMLAPVSEADASERELLDLGLRSVALWPAFAAELGVELRSHGTLLIARDRDEAEWLERERDVRDRLGLAVERLLPSQARRVEPALAPGLRLALLVGGEHAVEPREVLSALAGACASAGVVLRPCCEAVPEGAQTVLACGAWAGAPVRPVKGQGLRLRDPSGPGLCEHVLRWDGGYFVPRGDGRYYLGATMEEQGFDTAPTALAAYELLRDASELIPGALELELEEHVVGLRPGTPDNLPRVERVDARTVRATGHFRNGFLLAPLTAELVCEQLEAVPA